MPTLRRPDGATIHYRLDGDASLPPLLLIHGLAESGEAFADWLPHLAGGVRVIRPDLRGYGESTIPEGYAYRFADLVEDMAALLDEVGSAHVVGAKIGGTIAMQLAADRPDLALSLAAVGAPASLTRMLDQAPGWIEAIRRDGVEAWVRATTGNRMGSSLPPEKLEWWIGLMSRTRPETLTRFLVMVPGVDVTASLPRIAAPTLVVTTSGSGLGSVDEVRRWQQTIPGSTLHVIEADSYHVAGSHPGACAEAVFAFIDARAQPLA
jgi:pimeloyl-ACP methyl ester carboxylesterase